MTLTIDRSVGLFIFDEIIGVGDCKGGIIYFEILIGEDVSGGDIPV